MKELTRRMPTDREWRHLWREDYRTANEQRKTEWKNCSVPAKAKH